MQVRSVLPRDAIPSVDDPAFGRDYFGDAADGRALERAPARRLFAFAWRDDHGDDAFYSGSSVSAR